MVGNAGKLVTCRRFSVYGAKTVFFEVISMANPWEEIDLGVYERHMSLDSVAQLQALNRMMRDQLEAYPVRTAMILGVAGGNGLEHVRREKYDAVFGVDLNRAYLRAAAERYPNLDGVLRLLPLDLTKDAAKLPQAKLVIANLLIEYIGYAAFQAVIEQVRPRYVSCVIQINDDTKEWVSDSPYLHAFDGLDAIHCQMDPQALTTHMAEIGYSKILQTADPLPNGKQFLRLDYSPVDSPENNSV